MMVNIANHTVMNITQNVKIYQLSLNLLSLYKKNLEQSLYGCITYTISHLGVVHAVGS